jgi:hypothetical protein
MQTSVALDGNPEPDLVHATGCKQPTFRSSMLAYSRILISVLFQILFLLKTELQMRIYHIFPQAAIPEQIEAQTSLIAYATWRAQAM